MKKKRLEGFAILGRASTPTAEAVAMPKPPPAHSLSSRLI